jgi:hypothetical protein
MAQRLRIVPTIFHSFHKRWGAITGPGREAESARSHAPEPPGEFVSDELRDDCARFLDELRTMIHHRGEAEVEAPDWVPAPSAKPG